VENREKLTAIIEGCLRNERRSQEQLFKHFYGKMLSVCMRYVADRDTAQEVLQEGFIKVFEKLGAFDYKGSFEGWMKRIVQNTAINSYRSHLKFDLHVAISDQIDVVDSDDFDAVLQFSLSKKYLCKCFLQNFDIFPPP
jgi:RNA polymerase sigma-70 factor (ECF subfamily)